MQYNRPRSPDPNTISSPRDEIHYYDMLHEDDEVTESLSDHSSTDFSLSDIFLDSDSIIPTSMLPTEVKDQQKPLHTYLDQVSIDNDTTNLHSLRDMKENKCLNQIEHAAFADQAVIAFHSKKHSINPSTKHALSKHSSSLGKARGLQPSDIHTNIISNHHTAPNTRYPTQEINNIHHREERTNFVHGSDFLVEANSLKPPTPNSFTSSLMLPTNLHTYTILKEIHHKKELEFQQELKQSKAREERYIQKIQDLQSSKSSNTPVITESGDSLRSVDTQRYMRMFHDNNNALTSADPSQKNPFDKDDVKLDHVTSDNLKNKLEVMERKYQLELENMRIVAEEVQADADRRITMAEKYAADLSQQLQDMNKAGTSSEDATIWRQRFEHLVDSLSKYHTQGIWVTKDSTNASFHQAVLDSLQLDGDWTTGDSNVLEHESWKQRMSSFSSNAIEMQHKGETIVSQENTVSVESHSLIIQVQQMKSAHAKIVQENASLRLAKEATEDENLRLVKRGIELEQVAEDAMKECEHLNKVICTLETEKEEMKMTQEQLSVDIANLRDEASMSKGLITRLQEDLSKRQNNVESLTNMQTKADQQIDQLQEDLINLKTTSSNLKIQLEDKERLLSEFQRSKTEVEDELMCQKNLNLMMKRKLESLESEISSLKEKQTSLSKEKENADLMVDQLRTESIILSKNRTDLELECSRLTKELEENGRKMNLYDREAASLRKEIMNAESDRSAFSDKLDSVLNEKDVLTEELDLKSKAVQALSTEITDLKEQLHVLRSRIESADHIRKSLEVEREYIIALMAHIHNDTFTQMSLKDKIQHILHQLDAINLDKDALSRELKRVESVHLCEINSQTKARDEIHAEQNRLRNAVEAYKQREEEYHEEKLGLFADRQRYENYVERILFDRQNEVNDLLAAKKQLERECQHLSSLLMQEKEAHDLSKTALQRECDHLRSNIVQLEARKAAFLTEVQRITSPLTLSQHASRTSPADFASISIASITQTLHSSAPKESSDVVSSSKDEMDGAAVKDLTQSSLSSVKHSLFPISGNSTQIDIEARLISLKSASQRAMDAMKRLQSTNTSSISSPSLRSSPISTGTHTNFEISETEKFVHNVLFRKCDNTSEVN